DPFIPSGNENKFRIEGNRSIPLLLKVISMVDGTHCLTMTLCVRITPSENSWRVHCRQPSCSRPVLGHTDGHFLYPAIGLNPESVLRKYLQPAPLVVPGRPLVI